MEMTTYQAVFAVLAVFFVGDFIGAITKAKISSMFVIMMGFMVLFMTGVYPADIMETSKFGAVASVGMYFLLFNMGTSVDLKSLKKEWKTVVCSVLGMVVAIVACIAVSPIIGLEYALVSAPIVNGGIVATNIMVEGAMSQGMAVAAALGTFVYAVQKFVGTLPASSCGLSVANIMVKELREKKAADPSYAWGSEVEKETVKKTMFWEKNKKYYTAFICLGIAAGAIMLAEVLGKITTGWVGMTIWTMLIGITLRNTGLVPPNMLRDQAKANGFFSFLAMCTIIPALAKIDVSQIPEIGFKALVVFIAVVLLTYIVFMFTPAWKLVGSKKLSIGIAMCQMVGYPATELVASEIANAVGQTAEETEVIYSKIQTAYVISGFVSVTILSVFIADFLVKFI